MAAETANITTINDQPQYLSVIDDSPRTIMNVQKNPMAKNIHTAGQ